MFEKLEDLGCFWGVVVIIMVIALLFGILCFEGWMFMALWNWLLVGFGLAEISFLKGCGFVILLNLVGGFFRSTTKIKKD